MNINDFIKENYQFLTAKEIAIKLNVTKSTVQNRVFVLGLKKGNYKKYTLNNNFFKNPDVLSSYWAGFLAADGYVRTKLNHIGLRLSSKDKEHIVKFAKDISYNGPIIDITLMRKNKSFKKGKYYSSGLTICGAKNVIADLKDNFNIVQKKSFILQPPINLSNLNKLAYIKGIIDGDGTIIVAKNGRLEFSVVGTKEILNYIKQTFDELVPTQSKLLSEVRKRRDKTTKNHYTYKVTGFRALSILEILDKIKTPKLERKWNSLKTCKRPIYICPYMLSDTG